MRTLSQTQIRILESTVPEIVQRAVGLSGDALREALHPVWARTVTAVFHETRDCPCQAGGTCFLDLPAVEQDIHCLTGDALSIGAFIARYEEACRQVLDDTSPTGMP